MNETPPPVPPVPPLPPLPPRPPLSPLPPMGRPTHTSELAVWSLVLGILSLMCFTFIAGIPGVICGHKALTRIRRARGEIGGESLAIAGLVTGYLGIAITIFMVPMLMAIAIPNFIKARETSQQNACINNLRQMDAAKHEWALENHKSDQDVPTQTDLKPYFKNEQFPICPAGGTYTIGAVGVPPTCSVPNHVFQ